MKKARDLLSVYSISAAWQRIRKLPAGWRGTRDGGLPLTVPVRHHARVAAGPHESQQPVNQMCMASSSNREHELRADKGIVLCVKPLLIHSAKYSGSSDDCLSVVNNCGSLQSCECTSGSCSGSDSFKFDLDFHTT